MVIIRGILLLTSLVFCIISLGLSPAEQSNHWSFWAFIIAQIAFFHFVYTGVADVDHTYPTIEGEGFFDSFWGKYRFTAK